MRLIDADELLINVWRDKPNDTVSIAKMINDASTIKDIPTKEDAEPIVDMDMTKIFMIGILLGYDKKQDEMDKFTEDIKRIFAPKPNTDALDKIRAEIKKEIVPKNSEQYDYESKWQNLGLRMALKVIDKYKIESEE